MIFPYINDLFKQAYSFVHRRFNGMGSCSSKNIECPIAKIIDDKWLFPSLHWKENNINYIWSVEVTIHKNEVDDRGVEKKIINPRITIQKAFFDGTIPIPNTLAELTILSGKSECPVKIVNIIRENSFYNHSLENVFTHAIKKAEAKYREQFYSLCKKFGKPDFTSSGTIVFE
jgi:hypothetical protein